MLTVNIMTINSKLNTHTGLIVVKRDYTLDFLYTQGT